MADVKRVTKASINRSGKARFEQMGTTITDPHQEIEIPSEKTCQTYEELGLSFLSREAKNQLSSLGKEQSKMVGYHIATAQFYLELEPNKAFLHAKEAATMASRISITRETLGMAAYRIGNWQLAIRELRTARRMNGSNEYLPMIADSFRGLGRPEEVFKIVSTKEVYKLDINSHIEMAIVLAGAYADIGDTEKAISTLSRELRKKGVPSISRLRLNEAKATMYEMAGKMDEANKVWDAVKMLRSKIDEPQNDELIVYDIMEEDSE